MKFIVALLSLLLVTVHQVSAQGLSDNAIRSALIEQSIAEYSGSCPCPYNTMRNDRQCGRSSAYSRPGGQSPLCFPSDVSAADIAAFRARNTASSKWTSKPSNPQPAAPTPMPGTPEPVTGTGSAKSGADADECPPGTAPTRWNGRNVCVGTQESLARAAGTAATEPSANEAGSGPVTFADVLSRLQARAATTGEPVDVPVRPGQNRSLAQPATGLLNCAPGTRVSYLDGRIECR